MNEILKGRNLLNSKMKSKKKETKKMQTNENPNNSKISTSEKHVTKKGKEGEILEDNNLYVKLSSASSSVHEIV